MSTAKSKVLMILHMPPPVHGAAMVGQLIRSSALVGETFDCRFVNLSTSAKIEELGKFGVAKFTRFFSLLGLIRRTIKEFRPDLIYLTPNSCGRPFYKDFLVLSFIKCFGIKTVLHYHNKGVSTRHDRFADNLLYRHYFRNVDLILLSESLYDDVSKYVSRDRVRVCPNGIADVHVGNPPVKSESRPEILFLSNILIDKGAVILLDALQRIKSRGLDFSCSIVGAESYDFDRDSFQKEINKRSLEDRVVYKGAIYGEEKNKTFSQSDIFVLPTLNDCFPLVLLEAMRASLPCVASEEGGIVDIVEDNVSGYLVPKGNVDALAERISRLIMDPDARIRMGQASRQRFENLFTVEAFEKAFVRSIKDCL